MKKLLQSGYFQLLGMLSITICAQCVSLLKGSLTASLFGTTMYMDAFNLSNSIATFLFSFIGTGVTNVFIPNLVKKVDRKAINTFLSVLYTISLGTIVITYLLRNYLLVLFAHGNTSYLTIASSLMIIILFSQFLTSITSVVSAYSQCDGRYIVPQILNLCGNVLLLGMIVLNRSMTIFQYANYILISSIITLSLQIFYFRKNHYTFYPAFQVKSPDFIRMVRTFIPTLFGAGLYQITLITDSLVSSSLGEGEISRLAYSNTVISMINNLFVNNLMTFIYPKLIKNIDDSKNLSFLVQYMVLFFAIMMYVASAFMIGGKFAISLIYEHGQFSAATTDIVYICVMIYLAGIPFNIMRELLYRFFYSINDTMTPFKNSWIASVMNFTISIILARFIGLYGIVLGTSITALYSFSTISYRARHYLTKADYQNLALECSKVVLSILICYLLFHAMVLFTNPFINFFVMEVLNFIVFIFGIFALKSTIFKIRL